MSFAKRGGLTLKTGKIGAVNCIRQQVMMPGERMDINLNGNVRLESLRERDVMRINAKLLTFMTPMRWVNSTWTDYVKQGPDTAIVEPVQLTNNLATYGIGSGYPYDPTTGPATQSFRVCFQNSLLRIYNEWLKWPEDADIVAWPDDGPAATPLEAAWSRCRYSTTPDDADDYDITLGATLDVREIAEKQALFRAAMKRDVLSFNRWMELVKNTWDGDGSREVDQVPMLIDQTEVGVNPREMPATDGFSFGQWQSIFDFQVNHSIRGVIAPEHCIISYILIIRFAPITESVMPLSTNFNDWPTLVGDPEYIGSEQPQQVQIKDVIPNNDGTVLGFLPAGWQWRCEHNVIGTRIEALDTFPFMNAPSTQANAKDATRIKNAFRSKKLGDYIADIYITENSRIPIGTSMDSYFSGMVSEAKGKNQSQDELPGRGKML